MTGLRGVGTTLVVSIAVLCLVTLGAPSASADTFISTIGTGNSALSGLSAPFAEVNVTLTSSTMATVTFTSDVVNGNIYLFGGAQAVDVNVNAASWTIGSFTASNSGTGFTPGILTDGGSNNADGFGVFNQTVDSFDGFTHSSDDISFVLTNTSGTWASAANVLTGNADGLDAAAHIFVTSFPADQSNGALVTGFAAEGATTAAPEPSSFALLLTGLIGFVGARRRKSLA